jgi:hypothetical protein
MRYAKDDADTLTLHSVVGTAKLTAVHDKFLALEATKGSGSVTYLFLPLDTCFFRLACS